MSKRVCFTDDPLAFEPLGIMQIPREKTAGLYLRKPDGELLRLAKFDSDESARLAFEAMELLTKGIKPQPEAADQ